MCIKKRKEKDEFLKFILKQVTHFFSFKFYEEMIDTLVPNLHS
jgi:hypothetical protein